jgi:predicted enzyme related to lactoylglutathione lyase
MQHDVTFVAVSRAPLAKIQSYKKRIGWRFPWASSYGSDFNFDYHVSFTPEEVTKGYNYEIQDVGIDDAFRPRRVLQGRGGPHFSHSQRSTIMATMSPVVHFEMPAEDRRRMASFYEKTFGWKTQMLGPDMGDYVIVTTAESDVKPGAPAGAINGGFFPKKPDWPAQYPSIVIAVDDIESAMRRVGKEGGKVLGEPMQIPGVGRYVSFFDTEGNRVSMLQPDRA